MDNNNEKKPEEKTFKLRVRSNTEDLVLKEKKVSSELKV